MPYQKRFIYIQKFTLAFVISIFFLSANCIAQSNNTLTVEQVTTYSDQTEQLVSYLEGTLNFLGDPNELPSDKDLIINSSFLKIFASDKVQIEDDLDENREITLNKDVQAYLKDIDFFYKKIKFGFEVENVEQLVTDSGLIVFKLTLNRHLEGITINDDTVSNNQLRYIEFNLDPQQRDLKIASIYTTKVREKEGLRYWWNTMSSEWKNFFGKSVIVYDTLPFKNIIWFSDSSLAMEKWVETIIADTIYVNSSDSLLLSDDDIVVKIDTLFNLIPDTVRVNTSTIYRLLKSFRNIKKIDLSNNLIIKNLTPLSELTELVDINISNTLIEDLSPIRNLNKLEVFNCSGTPITFIEPLRYITAIKELNCSNTPIENIDIIENLRELSELDLSNTKILQLDALSKLKKLAHLKISKTNMVNLSPLNKLRFLTDLNISNTQVRELTSIDSLTSIQNLNIDSTGIVSLEPLSNLGKLTVLQANNTAIADLSPLNNHLSLKVIYCDNSNVTMSEANSFMNSNQQCLVIYNSQELINWWSELSVEWKDIFRNKCNISSSVTKENLHQLINQTNLSIAYNKNIISLKPLRMLHRLENLDMQHTDISNLAPLSGLYNLEKLNLNNTDVSTLNPLSSLQNIKQISFENTEINDLTPLLGSHSLEKIYCDKSKITQEKAISFKNIHTSCLIVYQSQKLKLWWNNLDNEWMQMLSKQYSFSANPSNEELQELVNLQELIISNNLSINNLNPLHVFVRLEKLTVTMTSVTDISPITSLKGLKKLNISGNPIFEIASISNLVNLKELVLKNTSVEDLKPISEMNNLVFLNISGTKVKSLKYIQNLHKLERLYLNNTRIKNLKPIMTLPKLELLQCYNTLIRSSKVDEFKKLNSSVEVVYY